MSIKFIGERADLNNMGIFILYILKHHFLKGVINGPVYNRRIMMGSHERAAPKHLMFVQRKGGRSRGKSRNVRRAAE